MLKKYQIDQSENISTAISIMKKNKENILIVINKKKEVVGIVTPGDLYKSLINSNTKNPLVHNIMNKNYYSIKKEEELLNIFYKKKDTKILHIPIIKKKKLTKIFFYQDILKKISRFKNQILNFSAIIMAGGYGSRMGNLAIKTPKPLLKDIDKKPIILNTIQFFKNYQINKIYVSLFHEKEVIKKKIKQRFNNEINFVYEKTKSGSIAAIRNLNLKNNENLLVINCDTILKFNPYIVNIHHKKLNNDLTIVCSIDEINYNYGLVNVNKKSEVMSLIEKPINEVFINTGCYVLNKKIAKIIPKNKKFDADELINLAVKKNFKVGVFPIYKEMWTDIGTEVKYKDYLKYGK